MVRVGGGRDIGRDRETQGYGGKKRKKEKRKKKKVQISPTFNLNCFYLCKFDVPNNILKQVF